MSVSFLSSEGLPLLGIQAPCDHGSLMGIRRVVTVLTVWFVSCRVGATFLFGFLHLKPPSELDLPAVGTVRAPAGSQAVSRSVGVHPRAEQLSVTHREGPLCVSGRQQLAMPRFPSGRFILCRFI